MAMVAVGVFLLSADLAGDVRLPRSIVHVDGPGADLPLLVSTSETTGLNESFSP